MKLVLHASRFKLFGTSFMNKDVRDLFTKPDDSSFVGPTSPPQLSLPRTEALVHALRSALALAPAAPTSSPRLTHPETEALAHSLLDFASRQKTRHSDLRHGENEDLSSSPLLDSASRDKPWPKVLLQLLITLLLPFRPLLNWGLLLGDKPSSLAGFSKKKTSRHEHWSTMVDRRLAFLLVLFLSTFHLLWLARRWSKSPNLDDVALPS